MDENILSFFIGAISSLLSIFISYKIKKLLSRNNSDNTYYITDSKGDTREATLKSDSTENDIKNYITSAMEYEKMVSDAFMSISPGMMIKKAVNHDGGYDFLIRDRTHKMLVEVKSSKSRVTTNTLSKLIYNAKKNSTITDIVICSKSGFSRHAYSLAKDGVNKNLPKISLITGDNIEKIVTQIKELVYTEYTN